METKLPHIELDSLISSGCALGQVLLAFGRHQESFERPKKKTWKVSERKDHAHMNILASLIFDIFCWMICLLSILISHHCGNNDVFF